MFFCFISYVHVYFLIFNAEATSTSSIENSMEAIGKEIEDLENYEIVYPHQYLDYHHKIRKRDINAQDEKKNGIYFNETFFTFKYKNKNYVLDLHLNKELLSDSFSVINYTDSGMPQIFYPSSQEKMHCYYHGTVRGINGSKVVVSTCRGLSGYIKLPDEFFVIKPILNAGNPANKTHVAYRPSDLKYNVTKSSCAVLDTASQVRYPGKFDDDSSLLNLADNKIFVELMLVADHGMFVKYGSTSSVQQYLQEVANFVDGFYQELGIRVVLTGIDVWNTVNKISFFKDNPFQTLEAFAKYRTQLVFLNPTLPWAYSDVVHLLFSDSFVGKTIGVARVGVMCGTDAVGLDQDLSDAFNTASTVAHEMGHNFGMQHDAALCYCPPKKECLMAADARFSAYLTWSSCSKVELQKFLKQGTGYCLSNIPKPSHIYGGPVCGNDIVEYGEECDCGYPELCTSQCCNPTNCQFIDGAVCDMGSCCKNCRYVLVGTICRPSSNECELPEYCNGMSPYCPPDSFKQDGTPCLNGIATCSDGKCVTRNQLCEAVWGLGSQSAIEYCYNLLNKKGDEHGNCGMTGSGDFISCSDENVKCGKLMCEGGKYLALNDRLGLTSIVVLRFNHSKSVCKTTKTNVLSMHGVMTGMVASGTICGKNKVCKQGECLPVDLTCSKKCHGRGICNNYGGCHCHDGWAPPSCNQSGNGGSLDNGQYGTVYYGPIATERSSQHNNGWLSEGGIAVIYTISGSLLLVAAVLLFFILSVKIYKNLPDFRIGERRGGGNISSLETSGYEENSSRRYFSRSPSHSGRNSPVRQTLL